MAAFSCLYISGAIGLVFTDSFTEIWTDSDSGEHVIGPTLNPCLEDNYAMLHLRPLHRN